MSLSARDVIKRANRLMGALATGDDPSNDELQDAFTSLNSMTRAMFGTIIGPKLSAYPMSAALQAENGGLYQVALSVGATLTAPLKPRGGARFGIVDVKANFSTNNLTIAPNGQLIEGAASNLVLSTNGANFRWFFEADTGNWVREADIATVDTAPPFPDRLIAYMPAMLAVYIAREYGANVENDTIAMALEGRQAFARNYSRRGRNQIDAPIGVQIQELAKAGG